MFADDIATKIYCAIKSKDDCDILDAARSSS